MTPRTYTRSLCLILISYLPTYIQADSTYTSVRNDRTAMSKSVNKSATNSVAGCMPGQRSGFCSILISFQWSIINHRSLQHSLQGYQKKYTLGKSSPNLNLCHFQPLFHKLWLFYGLNLPLRWNLWTASSFWEQGGHFCKNFFEGLRT